MTTDTEQSRRSRPWLIINALLAAAGLSFAVWATIFTLGHPFGAMRAPQYLMVWASGFLGANRGLALAQAVAGTRRLALGLRLAKWLLPVVLPLVLIGRIEAGVLERQMRLAQEALAPVIAHLESHARDRDPSDGLPALQFPVPVRYGLVEDAFALWLNAPSIDIDGYMIRYDSAARSWQRTHNDLATPPELPELCVLSAGRWRCPTPLS